MLSMKAHIQACFVTRTVSLKLRYSHKLRNRQRLEKKSLDLKVHMVAEYAHILKAWSYADEYGTVHTKEMKMNQRPEFDVLSNSYTMACLPVRGDNSRALASGLP